jgi:hypothetical protein
VTDIVELEQEQAGDRFAEVLARLSRQSVEKHFDAYVDIPWDDPGWAIDQADPRWELAPDAPLAGTDWYRSQPAETRSRLGLHLVVSNMKAGLQFENILERGLLEYAFALPDRSPEFRYAYHEIIEESQHSLMFQEFVNRSGLDAPGLTWDLRLGSRAVVQMARRFPAMFFVFVLGGEDPIDHVQRRTLRSGRELHPLIERIMRIHVTEEARHLSFARQYLRHHVPQLPARRRLALSVQAPVVLSTMASVMMRPPRHLVREYEIPAGVIRQTYGRGTPSRQQVRESLRKVRALLVELGLVTSVSKRLWRALDVWDEPGTAVS